MHFNTLSNCVSQFSTITISLDPFERDYTATMATAAIASKTGKYSVYAMEKPDKTTKMCALNF